MSAEYEFDAQQNRTFARLAFNARLAGVMNLVLTGAVVFATMRFVTANGAGLADLTAALALVGVLMVLTAIYGVWLLLASSRFARIVSTQGSDMAHLMAGFRELANIYQTQYWVLLVAIALWLASVVFAFVSPAAVLVVSFVIFQYASIGKVFAKAGYSGWSVVIPIYNTIVLLQVARRPAWWFFLLLVPGVGVVFAVLTLVSLAKAFNRGAGFAIGLLLLPWIFFPILAFGRAEYYGGSMA